MASRVGKTFWDIERERTWRIYGVFGFLLALHFVSVFLIWIIIKFFIFLRISFTAEYAPFKVFGFDTWLVLIIAVVAATVHWRYSSAKVVNRILRVLHAQRPDKYDRYHSIFGNVVDEIEVAAGGLKVERYILPTGAMNAFAVADFKGRKALGVTEGLLSRLNRDELQSVVAHEMAHIVSEDCLQTTMTCSLAGVYGEALAQFNRALRSAYSNSPSSALMEPRRSLVGYAGFAIPVLIILFILDVMGTLLNMLISREREYRADASAVKLTRNPASLASALYKISTRWRGAGYGGEHLSPIFILSPQRNLLDEREGLVATLFSTHPPLIKRLQLLLNLAHADLGEIAGSLQKREEIRTARTVKKPTIRIFVEKENSWLGPFTVLQLETIDWLTPKTRLRIDESARVLSADEIPELNRFFYEKKNEPMWKMKRLCPICRQWLVVQRYEGLQVWRCAFCSGMLAERGKLPRIFAREERDFTENVHRAAAILRKDAQRKRPDFRLLLGSSQPRPCPKCGQPMRRKFYSYAYHVEVDECAVCRLVWFDEDELEILQCLIEMEGDRD